MHIHILGICGTFMGSLALIAREAGHRVTGCDLGVYPPMSTQLEQAGIELVQGFSPEQMNLNPDMYVVGNVVSRGNPLMEAILNSGAAYLSGPQWLREHVLQGRWVLAVAGTHGKTTTASMLAWILEYAGMQPGFLIGGVPGNFPCSARLGGSDFFVIEADEYDTAFFDKRSKFIHYKPNTLIINNLEFDHADIFPDLAAIQRQFHHLVRTVPGNGLILYPHSSAAIQQVLAEGCWSELQATSELGGGGRWEHQLASSDGSAFSVNFDGETHTINWGLVGEHNVLNGVSAMAAARHVGVLPELAAEALVAFQGVKRRLELLAEIGSVRIYDDFAHHPTAIRTTLAGLRAKVGNDEILAIIEPRSNTMKQGVHRHQLTGAVANADTCLWFQPEGMDWSLKDALGDLVRTGVYHSTSLLLSAAIDYVANLPTGRKLHIVIMSNGGFDAIHQRLISALQSDTEFSVRR